VLFDNDNYRHCTYQKFVCVVHWTAPINCTWLQFGELNKRICDRFSQWHWHSYGGLISLCKLQPSFSFSLFLNSIGVCAEKELWMWTLFMKLYEQKVMALYKYGITIHSIRCSLLQHMQSGLSLGHKSEPCKNLKRSICANSRHGWCIEGPVRFCSTTEHCATGFCAAHCTYQRFARSVCRTVQFNKLQERISDRCSVPNCTYHYA